MSVIFILYILKEWGGGVEAKLPPILKATLGAASVSCPEHFISGTKCHCPHVIIGCMGHRKDREDLEEKKDSFP